MRMEKLRLSCSRGLCLGVTALLLVACGGHETHWGYSGSGGPEDWGRLDARFVLCETGRNQAPIDITGALNTDLEPIRFAYRASDGEILNNGHSIQVNVAPGNRIVIEGGVFELKQFHFHTPSENLIDGRFYDMEAHLVHVDTNGNLAVIGVMFARAESNLVIAELWAQMPETVGAPKKLTAPVDPLSLLPEDKSYFRFNGSLTTPPCSEGVRWIVMKSPLTVSPEQVAVFSRLMQGPNNRPIQPIGARLILE